MGFTRTQLEHTIYANHYITDAVEAIMIWAMKLLMGKRHMNSVLSMISGRLLWTWVYHGFVTRVTRRLRLVEQEVLTLLEYLSSSPVFSDARSLVFCVVFIDNIALPSVLFLLAIVLFVLLRVMVSDYPFSIFKRSCVTEKQSHNEFCIKSACHL